MLPEVSELIQLLQVILDHYDGVGVLFLLVLIVFKVILLFDGGDLKHGYHCIQYLRKPSPNELAIGKHEELSESSNDHFGRVEYLIEHPHIRQDLVQENLALFIRKVPVGVDKRKAQQSVETM